MISHHRVCVLSERHWGLAAGTQHPEGRRTDEDLMCAGRRFDSGRARRKLGCSMFVSSSKEEECGRTKKT